MGFEAKMILDSISPAGVRVLTMETTYPLIVHQDDLRHRTLWKTSDKELEEWLDASRSVLSNRALAPAKLREFVMTDPYIPQFVKATRGMVGNERLDEMDQAYAEGVWLAARDAAVMSFDAYEKIPTRIHKQHRNRLLIPFQWITVVTTANEAWWQHWFDLRDHEAAQPDMQIIARMAHDLYRESTPQQLALGDWHLPYVRFDEVMDHSDRDRADHGDPWWTVKRLSVARCARTSYMRQGEVMDLRDDLRLYDDLTTSVPPHDSPREHVVTPLADPDQRSGNLVGWAQLRHYEPLAA